jgi:hypothetical protein
MAKDIKPDIFKTDRIGFAQLYQDAKDYLTSRYLQSEQVFSPASAFGQILQVVFDLGKLIMYYVEDSLTELNIYTATRDTSIRSLARLAGHNAVRSIAATGTLKLAYNGASTQMYGNTLVIPNYTVIVDDATGFSYTITTDTEEIRLELTGKNIVEVKVTQGTVDNQEFTGIGTDLQSFTVAAKRGSLIDQFFVKVYVNSKEWAQFDSLYDMGYDTEGVLIKTGDNGNVDITFGNTFFGKVPAEGSTIRVEYLVSAGNSGNILEGSDTQFAFSDTVYDIIGGEVDANELIDISVGKPIIFGADPEPINLTRILAPRTSRAYVLVNADSYVYFLQKFNLFTVIDAFSTFDDDDITDDNIIYLFLIPDVNKRKPANSDYFTTPINLFILSDYEKNKVYDYIEESGQKIMGTEIKILDPIVKRYVLNINITAYEGYSKDTIRQMVISRCSDYFLNNRRRDRIPKSDLVSIIETVEGVDSVNLWFLSEENEVFKTDPANANKPDIGIDSFGDIVNTKGDYPLIRGGWKDRNGLMYYDAVDAGKPGSVNIAFGKDTPKTLNMNLHRQNIDLLKNS